MGAARGRGQQVEAGLLCSAAVGGDWRCLRIPVRLLGGVAFAFRRPCALHHDGHAMDHHIEKTADQQTQDANRDRIHPLDTEHQTT
ncbi:hypothetical protein SDC9_109043 [bioreactor metagenome]|uniref:Uncharacterized protein n=1 Tax=bioreactor metagenome TaxID=1076179 RepID=A0A645B9V1_9ZZZZ